MPKLAVSAFDQKRRALQRKYAQVRSAQAAGAHVDLVDDMLRRARQQLKS